MSNSLNHLRKLKSRLSMGQARATTDMSALEKVDTLEKTLSVFRAEVDMKLKIMQQILSTRNEQVRVHKNLLEKEQMLYDTLLGHWKNTPKLAATGLSVNFSAASADTKEDVDSDDVENQSDPDYEEGNGSSPEPRRKKSRSALRRQRSSAKSTAPNRNVKPDTHTQDNDSADQSAPATPSNKWEEGEQESQNPTVRVEIDTEVDEDDHNDFGEFLSDLNESNATSQSVVDVKVNQKNGREAGESVDSSRTRSSGRANEQVFVSAAVDGVLLELKLPWNFILELQNLEKERSIIGRILKHLYPIPYLRCCTLTGSSKGLQEDGTRKQALPADMVILIQEAVKKLLPPTMSPNTAEGRKLISAQRSKVRSIITSLLQYYRDEYNTDGSPAEDRRLSRKRNRKSRLLSLSKH